MSYGVGVAEGAGTVAPGVSVASDVGIGGTGVVVGAIVTGGVGVVS